MRGIRDEGEAVSGVEAVLEFAPQDISFSGISIGFLVYFQAGLEVFFFSIFECSKVDQKRLLTYMRYYSLNHVRVRYSGDTDIYIDIPIIFMSVSGPPTGHSFQHFRPASCFQYCYPRADGCYDPFAVTCSLAAFC